MHDDEDDEDDEGFFAIAVLWHKNRHNCASKCSGPNTAAEK
jgi:hypothetical protein